MKSLRKFIGEAERIQRKLDRLKVESEKLEAGNYRERLKVLRQRIAFLNAVGIQAELRKELETVCAGTTGCDRTAADAAGKDGHDWTRECGYRQCLVCGKIEVESSK